MKKWEYSIRYMDTDDFRTKIAQLNQWGDDGWELISIDSCWALLKRHKL